MKQLNKEFFNRDTVKVAKELVGKILQVDNVQARILETEAYKDDKASHARKKTPRSKIMYDTYGHIYVYFIYGMHHCLNITTDTEPGAVLIRAVEHPGCDGPGKLCKKLNITRKDNGIQLGGRFKILDDRFRPRIKSSERIGIMQDKHLKWRFYTAKPSNVKI
ncbi:MAG: DNA-3-methyladenine glycosylase [Candidatus Woesearchaeota archaeon]